MSAKAEDLATAKSIAFTPHPSLAEKY